MKRATRFLGARINRLVTVPEGGSSPVQHAPSVPIREIAARFWPYARPYRFWLCLSFGLILLVPAIAAAQIWMFKLAIDHVLVPRDLGPFVWIAVAYLGLTVVAGFVRFADDYVSAWIGQRFRTLATHERVQARARTVTGFLRAPAIGRCARAAHG